MASFLVVKKREAVPISWKKRPPKGQRGRVPQPLLFNGYNINSVMPKKSFYQDIRFWLVLGSLVLLVTLTVSAYPLP
jgi:hypothetical protein